MTANPLVSVIIPVYNCRYVGEAIESALAQTYSPVEILVLDDGSDDGSGEIAQAYASVRYHYQPNAGIAAARNRAIGLAEGAFLAFLDADDLWAKDKLALQMAELLDDPALDIVFAHVQEFHSPDLDPGLKEQIRCSPEPQPGQIPSATVLRRRTFEQVGPFETGLRSGEFISWYMRAQEQGAKMHMLPELLVWRRLHGDNHGIRQRQHQVDYVRLLKAALDRRRAEAASQAIRQ